MDYSLITRLATFAQPYEAYEIVCWYATLAKRPCCSIKTKTELILVYFR